ncbi:hypothetical protein ACWEKT_25085 [Nocardia takedensis]
MPIPGTAAPAHLVANLAAADLDLTDDRYRRLDRLVTPPGEP